MTALDTAISEAMAQLDTEQPAPAAPATAEPGQAVQTVESAEADPAVNPDDPPAVNGEGPDGGDGAEALESSEETDDDEGTPPADSVEVAPDATYVLPDGTEVSGSDLRDGWLRQADYTRKTQELADQRTQVETLHRQMSEWYEERAGDPAAWIGEIAGETDNPAATLAQAIEAEGNPTQAVSWIIKTLAERGKLTPEFIERFELQHLAGKAESYEADTRVSRLEKQLQEQREAQEREAQERQQQQQQEQILADYQRQWSSIVAEQELQFGSSQDEFEARLAVMRFARDNQIPNLAHAYAAMPKAEKPSARKLAKDVVDRKRKARAVAPKAPPAGPTPRQRGDLDGALLEAANELGIALS